MDLWSRWISNRNFNYDNKIISSVGQETETQDGHTIRTAR